MQNNTSKSYPEQKSLTVDDIKEAMEIANSILDKPRIEKIEFSNAVNDDLRKMYYDAFEKLPIRDEGHIFSGIPIVESDLLVPNMMLIRFSNKTTRIFLYKDDKMYELKNTFEYLANKRIEVDNVK
jgi:hypothetical protein